MSSLSVVRRRRRHHHSKLHPMCACNSWRIYIFLALAWQRRRLLRSLGAKLLLAIARYTTILHNFARILPILRVFYGHSNGVRLRSHVPHVSCTHNAVQAASECQSARTNCLFMFLCAQWEEKMAEANERVHREQRAYVEKNWKNFKLQIYTHIAHTTHSKQNHTAAAALLEYARTFIMKTHILWLVKSR